MKDKRIAFDFDGVIAGTNEQKRKWFAEKNIKIEETDKTSIYRDLSNKMKKEEIDKLYKQMSKNIFLPEVLEKTEPIEDSINIIKKLSLKFDIYIITSRTKELIKPVNMWLKEYKIERNIKKIISSSFRKKQDICLEYNISFLCDDDLRHIEEERINTRVLFGKHGNISDNKIVVIDNWRQIGEMLLKG